ncbi:MAG TPA: molybdopterin-binding protein [Candidatus Limnocylindrales bacterium]|nr:molybdopterin-binding protein [Candidatus Limnocylindrales bacterium]
MRVERVIPGRRVSGRLAGAVLTRDLTVGGQRWAKGRRLSSDDLLALAAEEPGPPVTVLVADGNELHEDEAALRLAKAIAGPGLEVRGPNQSRLDLIAATDGVVNVRIGELERVNRLDPLEVFTVYDGQVVERGDLVASVKVAPHLVDAAVVEAGGRIAGFGSQPIVWVAPFVARRVGVVVKESIRATARERFEASVRAKVEGLGSEIIDIVYVEDDADAVETAVGRFTRGADTADLVLTAGSASTDPEDAFFVAIAELGGRVVRRGVPSHPGSMLWLARVGGTSILGLPTCGAYSKATAVDLLLPRLLAGEPASEATVAKLGHGGILTRDQRFRFPRYARDLDAPEG